jgi:hypothetical protein
MSQYSDGTLNCHPIFPESLERLCQKWTTNMLDSNSYQIQRKHKKPELIVERYTIPNNAIDDSTCHVVVTPSSSMPFHFQGFNVRTSLRPNVDRPCVIGTCSSWHIYDDIDHSSLTSRINFKFLVHSDPTRLHLYSSIDPITRPHHSIETQQTCLSSAQPVSASSRPLAPQLCAPNAPRSPSSLAHKQPETTALARATPRVRTPKTRAPTPLPTWSTPAHHHPRRVRAVARVPPRAARTHPTLAHLLSSLKVRKQPTSPSRRSQTRSRLPVASRRRFASTTNRWTRRLRMLPIRPAVKNLRRTRSGKISGRVSAPALCLWLPKAGRLCTTSKYLLTTCRYGRC